MNVEVRNINGVRGFCIYKGSVPYTYIYTRDAIGMLGMVQNKNGKEYLRIKDFGDVFNEVLSTERISAIVENIGVTLTPNYAISQDQYTFHTDAENNNYLPSHRVGKANPPIPASEYDHILPEFILDRVIFMIVNRMRSPRAQAFREALFMDIIPHFQQTATQEQIAKVPILNQTTQFMYDNTNVQFTAQQAYNFNKNIVFQYVNRHTILTGQTDIMDVFERLFNDFEYSLNHAGICVYDEIMKMVEARKAVNPYSPDDVTKEDILDTVICNLKMHNLFISFVANYIREKENELIFKSNDQVVTEEWNKHTGYYDKKLKYEDNTKLHPVRFITMDERSGESPLQERSFADDYLTKPKRDTSWMY
jgi:hypothetical protein